MPCDTVTQVTLRLERADKTLLTKTLAKLQRTRAGGFDWNSLRVDNQGNLTGYVSRYSGTTFDVASQTTMLKQAYSQTVVEQAADNGNWMLESWSKNESGQLTISAERSSM